MKYNSSKATRKILPLKKHPYLVLIGCMFVTHIPYDSH